MILPLWRRRARVLMRFSNRQDLVCENLYELGHFMLASTRSLDQSPLIKKTYQDLCRVDASAVNLRPAYVRCLVIPIWIVQVDRLKWSISEEVSVKITINLPNKRITVTEIGVCSWSMTLEPMDFQWGVVTFGRKFCLQRDGQAHLIRRAEKPEDYLATHLRHGGGVWYNSYVKIMDRRKLYESQNFVD